MSNWLGQTIGGYQIAEEIGQGGVATVYRAHQPQLERWVAIKIMKTAEASGKEFLTRFRREAKAIAALRHPNILTIYDYGEEKGTAYIVMEYVAGGTLKTHLAGEPMEWPDAATLILPLGRALEYAHSEGIVHRDVKPANILMARPDWPLLADFGLVKLLGRQRGITQPGVSIGTPAYFSPEQAGGEEVDHRTDVYGLGIVLYELLTGRLPFEAHSPIEMMLRRLREDPIPPRQFNQLIPPPLEAVIMRALARDPDARHSSMEALVNNLARLPGATGRPISSSSGDTPPPATTTRLASPDIAIGPRLVVMGTGAMISLPHQDKVVIGRSDPHVTPPDVNLGPYGGEQAGVSRHHAQLLNRSTGYLLEDLNSTNGTFINSMPVPPGQPTRVRNGDVILCGQFSLMFYEE